MGKREKHFLLINLEYLIAIALVGIFTVVSLKTAYFISDVTAMIAYYIDFRHRRRTIKHLLHSGIVNSKKDAVLLAKKNFKHLGKVLVEIVKVKKLFDKDNIGKYCGFRMKPEHKELFFGENPSPVIIVTGHLGNWELAGAVYSLCSGLRLSSIMRPLNNPRLGRIIYSYRENPMHKTFSKEDGLKQLLSALRKKESVAIVADQHASSSEGAETVFFGHPARAHSTPALLHLKTGIPIFVGALIRNESDFKFELDVRKVINYTPTDNKAEDIKNIVQEYTSALEEIIRDYPEQWLWSHRRWLDLR